MNWRDLIRELSQFSYSVSHDLKAPVNHVGALTQLLARRGQGMQEDSSTCSA